MSNPRLEWKDSSGALHRFEAGSDQVLIGRKSDSDIVLPNPYISRHHAKVVRDEGRFFLADLGSTHGTYLNGRRIERQEMRSGDRIGVGRDQVEILFLDGDGTAVNDPEAIQTAFLNLTAMMPMESERSELEKISLLLDFQYQWGQQFSADAMFRQVLTSALQISGAERGYILRRKEKSFVYALGLDSGLRTLPEAEFQTSRSVVAQASKEGKPVYMTEGISGEFAQQESIVAMNLRAVACLPLKGIGKSTQEPGILGILYLDSTKTMHALTGLDQKILDKLASEASNVMEKVEMIRSMEERSKLEQELALARETQVHLLPQEVPAFSGFQIRAFSRPTRYVGGDFYDFMILDESRLVGVLADVSGKGVSASLLSSSLQGALHMEFRSGASPEKALEDVNRFVCERSQTNRFVTLFLFILDPEGQGIFMSAGHNPSYIFRAGSGTVEELKSGDLILGAFSFATYRSHPLKIEAGDILVAYTDGVTEAADPDGEMFGEDQLIALIREHGAEGASLLEQRIFDALENFTQGMDQTDDITFILIQRA